MSNNEKRLRIILAAAVLTTTDAPIETAPADPVAEAPVDQAPVVEGQDPGTEGKAPEDEGKDQAPVVPEEYADFSLPEGVTFDTELLDEFKPLAKEFGLPQDQAQKFVDMGSKLVQKTIDGIFAAHQERVTGWLKEAEADKEIGEDIKKGKDSQTLRAFNSLVGGNEKIKAMVDETGIGNHPEFLRIFHTISQKMREDTFVVPGSGGGFSSPADTMYPTMKK